MRYLLELFWFENLGKLEYNLKFDPKLHQPKSMCMFKVGPMVGLNSSKASEGIIHKFYL
jgi:hypothetical protein